MRLIKSIHSWFKQWFSASFNSNIYESLAAVEAPLNSLRIARLVKDQTEKCCQR
ncbi:MULTISPECIES: hypothetical protein [Thalassotalea]|uniref:Uncharacterized protein n=1 Tax=Thalassotalea castellviae TaxID=3075612 RepID=A0ABU3A494_9GAMM|nr:hypothetical protein [Thalassotalea sp. W431]MDT0605002.1 hypothetical protein [Thalassotalea sp. W431]